MDAQQIRLPDLSVGKQGGPETLQLEEIEKPKVKENYLLVKVKANSINPVDWHILRGDPFAFRLTLDWILGF